MKLRHSHLGLSYIEVLVAATVLVLMIVPAVDSLLIAMLSGDVHQGAATQHYRVFGHMEELMAEAYGALETEALAVASPNVPTSYSDAAATVDRRLVFLSLYDGDDADGDGDPFTGTDPGLVWIRVEIEGTVLAMESLKRQ